jgi:hypothetical protein
VEGANVKKLPLDKSAVKIKIIIGNGKELRPRIAGFKWAHIFVLSKLLVLGEVNNSIIVTACGIRSPLNVLTLYVKEGYRHRRIGSRILREIIEISRNNGFNFITATTDSDNIPALRLYRKYNFKKIISLKKSDLTVLMLPLTLIGTLLYRALRVLCSVLSNELLEYLHETLAKTTKKGLW